jgi:GT2 family glycosyltransferase
MISIVVTWRDRVELMKTLPRFVATAAHCGGDLTLVNYGGNQSLLLDIVARSKGSACRVVQRAPEQYFNKARAQNLGAAHSRHSLLFFCDCDILLDETPIVTLARDVATRRGIFATIAGVIESEPNSRQAKNVACFGYELFIRLANGRTLTIVDNEEDAADGTRQAPGLLLVRREDFLRVGGYNGRLHGWGWEDQDMIARLTLAGGLERVQRGIVTHLSHDDSARVAHYPPALNRWESRDRMFRQALAYYDDGDFVGTFAADSLMEVDEVGGGL